VHNVSRSARQQKKPTKKWMQASASELSKDKNMFKNTATLIALLLATTVAFGCKTEETAPAADAGTVTEGDAAAAAATDAAPAADAATTADAAPTDGEAAPAAEGETVPAEGETAPAEDESTSAEGN
jgi:hypothetical protein